MIIKPKIVMLGKPLFLGITWLRQYNPDIDWENATLKWRDEESTLQLMEYISDNTINSIHEEYDYEDILDTLIHQMDYMQYDDYMDYVYEEINAKQNTSQKLFNESNKKRESDTKKAVPKKFHKFLKVFSKTESKNLPPR